MLLQAADLPVEGLTLFTTSQLLAGVLLLGLSAAFKAVVRAMDQGHGAVSALEDPNVRLAARLGQYLALVAGTYVLAAGPEGTGAALPVLAVAFGLYLVLLMGARVASTLAPRAVLRAMSLPMKTWSFTVSPLVAIGERVDAWAKGRVGAEGPEEAGDRLLGAIEASGLVGDELMIVQNALRFRDRSVGELMVPRPDVVWLSVDDDLATVLGRVRESGHSRFPLCLDSPDRVIGYVHVRDLALKGQPVSSQELRALARSVGFVPETASAMSVLRRFQSEGSHMAVVVDEFGGTAGIVTLEDLLEELVGEIRDEFDDEEVEITPLVNGEVLVDGAVRLDELERVWGLDFGEVEEETVGGFVFGRLAREVNAGDEVDVSGAVLRVEGVEGLRVTRIRVIPGQAVETA